MATTWARLAALEAWRTTVDARLAALESPAVPVPVPPPLPLEPSGTIRNPASGATIAHKIIKDVYGLIWNNGPDNVTIDDVVFDGCQFGLKLGASAIAGDQATGLKVSNVTTKNCIMGAFLANITGAVLTEWDAQSASGDPHNHATYLERELYDILIDGFGFWTTGATGYCCNMYASGPFVSRGITLRRGTMDARAGGLGPLTISYPYREVRLENVTLQQKAGVPRPVIMLGECANVVIDGFTATGGNALIGAFAGTVPQNIVLRNGTWDGAQLPSFPWLTLENVRLV